MSGKNAIKVIKKALEKEHLYSDEELHYMKLQLNILEKEVAEYKIKTSKGFGK
jgi:uncharacterized protein (UPF0216 family)